MTVANKRLSFANNPDRREETAYPVDTSAVVARLIAEYAERQTPIPISFRELVHWIPVGERATHYIHTYPGKLLPHIAHFFLSADRLIPSGGLVLDPFSGTGTVALEAILSGRNALYADVNPLAREITAAKTHPIDSEKFLELGRRIISSWQFVQRDDSPNVINVAKWFSDEARKFLSAAIVVTEDEVDPHVRTAMRVALSALSRKISRANQRYSVPVIDKSHVDCVEIAAVFSDVIEKAAVRHAALSQMLQDGWAASCVGDDARSLKSGLVNPLNLSSFELIGGSVDAVLTSPPYLSAQKYIRASSLSLGWLGHTKDKTLKQYEDASIGREHYRVSQSQLVPHTASESANQVIGEVSRKNKLRAVISATYINEMDAALKEIYRVLKPGGRFIMVMGNNTVCGIPFDNVEYMTELSAAIGFRRKLCLVDQIKSRSLTMQRRGGNSPIKEEYVVVFDK